MNINAGTLSPERKLLRVVTLILLYYVVLCYDSFYIRIFDTVIGIDDDLFHSASITYSFALLVGAIMLQLVVYYPRRLQEPIGATQKKMSFFLLTHYTIILLGSLLVIFFSLFYTSDYSLCLLVPIKIYENAGASKLKIYSENKGRAGIYLWRNLKDNKKYLGSAVNLPFRFRVYFSKKGLLNNFSMIICRALLAYGHSSFSLEILEYCEPSHCIEREKYYITLLSPEYNIVQDPTKNPMYGRKHSQETIKKISKANTGKNTGENNPMFGKTGEDHPNFGKPRPEGAVDHLKG